MADKIADYPATFPVGDATTIVAYLRGGVPRNVAVKSVWNLIGYGLSMVNFDVLAKADMVPLSDQDAASLIEEALAGDGKCATGFPWLALLVFLTNLLRQLLPVETQQT